MLRMKCSMPSDIDNFGNWFFHTKSHLHTKVLGKYYRMFSLYGYFLQSSRFCRMFFRSIVIEIFQELPYLSISSLWFLFVSYTDPKQSFYIPRYSTMISFFRKNVYLGLLCQKRKHILVGNSVKFVGGEREDDYFGLVCKRKGSFEIYYSII